MPISTSRRAWLLQRPVLFSPHKSGLYPGKWRLPGQLLLPRLVLSHYLARVDHLPDAVLLTAENIPPKAEKNTRSTPAPPPNDIDPCPASKARAPSRQNQ